jgi:hypothetical protein
MENLVRNIGLTSDYGMRIIQGVKIYQGSMLLLEAVVKSWRIIQGLKTKSGKICVFINW